MRILLPLLLVAVSTGAAQQHPTNVYFELGGEGLGLSANLDVGLTQSLRLRAGAGWAWTMGTVPLSASYLIGKHNNTLEVGGGVTFATGILGDISDDKDLSAADRYFLRHFFHLGDGTFTIPTGVIGWRYHPPDGAVLRVTLNPLLVEGRGYLRGGLSLGFTF